LIIDDEPALLLGVATRIKRHGYTVITAVDGSDGLQKAREHLPDLIVSDVMMPPPNGFELRALMSQDPQLASIPFIFLTARSSLEDRVSGLKEGADDYITKPFETEELFARIEAVLRRAQIGQERGRQEMKEIAQRDMEKLKQEIVQNFHHELRTPLTNVLMPLELAANHRFANPEEQSKFIQIALSNADRLESLITDLILLSNVDMGNLNSIRQRIDPRANIIAPIQKRLERYQAKNLNFVLDCPEQAELYAPRREFTHALVHLADNAFKFTPDNGNVLFRVTPDGNGGAEIQVRDDGPGIPAELREKVFERFYQISQGDNRTYEGLGIGLTIVQAVFGSVGGTVEIVDIPSGCLARLASRAWAG
jgi:signal transduction histidine kinase